MNKVHKKWIWMKSHIVDLMCLDHVCVCIYIYIYKKISSRKYWWDSWSNQAKRRRKYKINISFMFFVLLSEEMSHTFNLIIPGSMPHIPKMVSKKSTFLTFKNLIKPFLLQWLQTASPEMLKFIKDLKFV